MAIAPLQLPGYAAPQSLDFSSLANLGQVYKQASADANRQATLAQLGQGEKIDPRVLLASGDLSLANLGIAVQNRQQDQARQARLDERQLSRDAVDDNFRRQSLALQQRAAARADEGPVEKAAARARVASQYGLQPGTPEHKAFVLTGELPANNTTVQSQVEQRRAAAAQLNLDPSSPAYNSYVLTGKMPREDQSPLTATDKKAILEADEGVLSANTAIDALKKAKDLSPKAMGFKGASAIASVGSVLGNKQSQDTVELDNLITSNALTQLKSIFGGNPTEGERKIMLDIQGSSSLPDAVRQKIFDRAIGLAQNRLRFNEQRSSELRGGQFYKPQGSMSRAPVQQTQGITQQQYEALPSGSTFPAPDGTQRIKP